MSDHLFDDQVAIVTGSGAGMGKEHALLLASRGASVVVNDLAPTAQDVVDEITAAGGKAVLSRHDVSDPEQAKALIQTAIDSFGGLHIVVSNAAIIRSVRFIDMDYAAFDHIMKINAYGAFNVLNAAWPHLVGQKYGRVVMVSSSSAWTSQPEIGHYAASKGAVLGLAKTLASEGEEFDITVNVLAPGAFTAMAGSQDDPAAKKMMETMMPERPAVAGGPLLYRSAASKIPQTVAPSEPSRPRYSAKHSRSSSLHESSSRYSSVCPAGLIDFMRSAPSGVSASIRALPSAGSVSRTMRPRSSSCRTWRLTTLRSTNRMSAATLACTGPCLSTRCRSL